MLHRFNKWTLGEIRSDEFQVDYIYFTLHQNVFEYDFKIPANMPIYFDRITETKLHMTICGHTGPQHNLSHVPLRPSATTDHKPA